MKKLSKILMLCLVAILAFGLYGCGSSYNSLKKEFEKAGYTESEQFEKMGDAIREQAETQSLAITLHALTKDLNLVLIIEFNSTEDMQKLYNESSTIQGFVKDIKENEDAKALKKSLEEEGYAKGNCLVLCTNPLCREEVTNIVKNA